MENENNTTTGFLAGTVFEQPSNQQSQTEKTKMVANRTSLPFERRLPELGQFRWIGDETTRSKDLKKISELIIKITGTEIIDVKSWLSSNKTKWVKVKTPKIWRSDLKQKVTREKILMLTDPSSRKLSFYKVSNGIKQPLNEDELEESYVLPNTDVDKVKLSLELFPYCYEFYKGEKRKNTDKEKKVIKKGKEVVNKFNDLVKGIGEIVKIISDIKEKIKNKEKELVDKGKTLNLDLFNPLIKTDGSIDRDEFKKGLLPIKEKIKENKRELLQKVLTILKNDFEEISPTYKYIQDFEGNMVQMINSGDFTNVDELGDLSNAIEEVQKHVGADKRNPEKEKEVKGLYDKYSNLVNLLILLDDFQALILQEELLPKISESLSNLKEMQDITGIEEFIQKATEFGTILTLFYEGKDVTFIFPTRNTDTKKETKFLLDIGLEKDRDVVDFTKLKTPDSRLIEGVYDELYNITALIKDIGSIYDEGQKLLLNDTKGLQRNQLPIEPMDTQLGKGVPIIESGIIEQRQGTFLLGRKFGKERLVGRVLSVRSLIVMSLVLALTGITAIKYSEKLGGITQQQRSIERTAGVKGIDRLNDKIEVVDNNFAKTVEYNFEKVYGFRSILNGASFESITIDYINLPYLSSFTGIDSSRNIFWDKDSIKNALLEPFAYYIKNGEINDLGQRKKIIQYALYLLKTDWPNQYTKGFVPEALKGNVKVALGELTPEEVNKILKSVK